MQWGHSRGSNKRQLHLQTECVCKTWLSNLLFGGFKFYACGWCVQFIRLSTRHSSVSDPVISGCELFILS